MRILVDEDLASRDLIGRLEAVFPGDVLRAAIGAPDHEVWSRAQAEHAAVLTGNVIDFKRLAGDSSAHHGLLLVYRRNDAAKDLRAADIATAVRAIDTTYPAGITGLTLVVNGYTTVNAADS